MPSCQIQCGNESDYDCGTCRHRNLDYPWPGGVDSKLIIRSNIGGETVNMIELDSEKRKEAEEYFQFDAYLFQKSFLPVWSHWD